MENDEEVCIARGRLIRMQHEIIVLWFRITSPTKYASKPFPGIIGAPTSIWTGMVQAFRGVSRGSLVHLVPLPMLSKMA